MEEKQTKNKKVVIIIVAIVVVLAVAILVGIGAVISDVAQKQILSEEIEKINQTSQVDTEIKTSGKYAEVEKVLKDYVIEYQSIAKEMQAQYQNEKFTTILSADNYKNDGPDFVESKKLITDTRAKGEEVKTRLAEMASNEYKQKRADDNGLTGKYKDLFVDSIQFEQEIKQVDSTIDSVNNYLSKIEDVFNYLTENKNSWKVNGGKVEFNEMSQVTKYNIKFNKFIIIFYIYFSIMQFYNFFSYCKP